MQTVEMVRCPNCGSCAERYHLSGDQLIRTQCSACDYLMITCAITGKVIEAYAPGIDMGRFSMKINGPISLRPKLLC